jgi:hypothetical protein
MILRVFTLGRVAALLLVGLAFGASPAAAGCGYNGCYAPLPVPYVAQPYYYQSSCSCCGCGSLYYGSYYGAYTYPSMPYPDYSSYGYGAYGYGYGYGYGPSYGGYGGPVVGPRVYGSRPFHRRYVGPRRMYARARY